MGAACSAFGESGFVYRALVVTLEGRRLLERTRRRWENNIKMDVQELGCMCMNWIDLAEDRDKCRGVFNRQRNFVFHEMGNSLIS